MNGVQTNKTFCRSCVRSLVLVPLAGGLFSPGILSNAKAAIIDFVNDKPIPGIYSAEAGFGFERGSTIAKIPGGGVTSDHPFLFSIALSEGNYRVTATFGDPQRSTTNVVKAEARRLMLENVTTARGELVTRSFVVNIRTADFPGGKVHLKPRELTNEVVTWDAKLTLEFNGAWPVLRALDIEPATNVTTLFIAGDSTVCDQPLEPWNSWGQMLPRFFNDRVAVANYAESGESIRSSLGAHRFDKIFSVARTGDFLFIQFGHNDMKDHATNALTVYQDNLKKIVARARTVGVVPVLITSMERKAGISGGTLAGYPDAVRAVAREESVALIDLNAASVKLYRALGKNLDLAFQDGTHHNNYGSYELAKCVVEGIKENHLSLGNFLRHDVSSFDPSRPDDIRSFDIPASPMRDTMKPDGN